MKLWLISQEVNEGYDTFEEFITAFEAMDDTTQCIRHSLNDKPGELKILDDGPFFDRPEHKDFRYTSSEAWLFFKDEAAYNSYKEE